MNPSFFQLTLRTSDVDAARRFYAHLLGGSPPLHIVQLHEQAVARGARPHWLGYLEVADVDRATAQFVEHGAVPFGPKWVNPEGLEASVQRDPGGAIIALAKSPPSGRPTNLGPDVVRYVLNTPDVARAKASYGALLGWHFQAPYEVAGTGVVFPFAWAPGAPPAGVMIDIAARPGVHAHWLFHFRVTAMGAAVDAVRAAGGKVIGPITLPTGEQISVCDDPQGAAFALEQGPA